MTKNITFTNPDYRSGLRIRTDNEDNLVYEGLKNGQDTIFLCEQFFTRQTQRIIILHDDSDSLKAFVHKEQYKEFANDVPSLEKPFQCTECNKV